MGGCFGASRNVAERTLRRRGTYRKLSGITNAADIPADARALHQAIPEFHAKEKGTAPQTLLAVVKEYDSPTIPTAYNISQHNSVVNIFAIKKSCRSFKEGGAPIAQRS